MSSGVKSSPSVAVGYDNREGTLQELLQSGASKPLVYSGDWAENAARLDISRVCVRHAKNGTLLDVTTNSIFTAACPADGLEAFTPARLAWGEYHLLLREYANDGATLLEYQSPGFEIPHVYGTYILVR